LPFRKAIQTCSLLHRTIEVGNVITDTVKYDHVFISTPSLYDHSANITGDACWIIILFIPTVALLGMRMYSGMCVDLYKYAFYLFNPDP
jgi:hypothetical protein